MATIGFTSLIIAFIASILAAIALSFGHSIKNRMTCLAGKALVALTFFALLICCAVLVVGFMVGDYSIKYVLEERSLSTDSFAWLYKLSGLWAGRAGSLLFWAFLIALFNGLILTTGYKRQNDKLVSVLDSFAMTIISVVVAIFCGLLLFSEGNMPFTPTPLSLINEFGELTETGSSYALNQLLEHWAMAIHPPLLFVGYAGLTVPFAYAIAALIENNFSKEWVLRCQPFVLISWLFLGAGIGLGAVWAYGVLGWGGYWGWDPVENASLAPWLVCVALIHTFTIYCQRGAFKQWAIICASLSFTFVIVATFITRSGFVQSVHAFSGDPVSLALFGVLIVLSIVLPIGGLILRKKSFTQGKSSSEEIESIFSKDAAYYFNNVIMLALAFLITYMTIAPGLPLGFPFAGESFGASSFGAIARPMGILYLFILAVCPLLSWGKTNTKSLIREARIPLFAALVLFIVLVLWWSTQLLPTYDAMVQSDSKATELLEAGPSWYYNGLALVGFFVAALLFFNAAFMFVRSIRRKNLQGSLIGGSLSHLAMAIILIGLIGSSMYVYEKVEYMPTNQDSKIAESPMQVREYQLIQTDQSISDEAHTSNKMVYNVTFDIYKNDQFIGTVSPSVQVNTVNNQRKLNAEVLSSPVEDLFIVYRGVNNEGALSMDVRINPFITVLWTGFAILLLGMVVALVGKRERN